MKRKCKIYFLLSEHRYFLQQLVNKPVSWSKIKHCKHVCVYLFIHWLQIHWAGTGIVPRACAKSLPLCPTLCDPMDFSVTHQASLCIRCSRQEYRSGLPCSSPGDLPNPGIEPDSLKSSALAVGFLTTRATLLFPNSFTEREFFISIL